MKLLIACFCLLLTGCGAKSQAYRLILVEKSRDLYSNSDKQPCQVSGYDIEKIKEDDDGNSIVELWITYKNCGAKERVILDDRTKPMWGVPIIQDPKKKDRFR